MNNDVFMNDTFDNLRFTQTEQYFSNDDKDGKCVNNNSQEILFDDTLFLSESCIEENNDGESEDFFANTPEVKTIDDLLDNKVINSEKQIVDYSISQTLAGCLENEFLLNSFKEEGIINVEKSFTETKINVNNNMIDLNIDADLSNTFTQDITQDESPKSLPEFIIEDNETNSFNHIENTNTNKREISPKVKDNSINIRIKKSCQDNNSVTRDIKTPLIFDKLESRVFKTPNPIKAKNVNIPHISTKNKVDHINLNNTSNFDNNLSTMEKEAEKGLKELNTSIEEKICRLFNANSNSKQINPIDSSHPSTSTKLTPEIQTKNIVNMKSTKLIPEIQNENVMNEESTKLQSWGLPEAVLLKYKSRKVISMFPWQVECLSNTRVMNETANLIYSAPTSAGKTLIAEILAIKTVFERKKKVIFILPFVSIVREKMYYFQDILGSSGIRCEGFMGSYNPPGGFQTVQVAICTIEKANSLINRLLEEGKLSDIGAILVDEMHLLGDPSRGYLLELLLTKLKYISQKDENVNIQIVGMSATLPNLSYLAKWLDAELYTTDFRPIPLLEQAHVCGEIYDNNLKLIRKLQPLPDLGTDTDNILQLCLETIQESCSVLIFCPTKNWCENLSQQISVAFFKIGNSNTVLGSMLRSQLKTNLIMELMEQLRYCPAGLDEVLKKTVSFGVAFHHAGLTMDERDIIEGAFRNGGIRVLVATSTLSSGVNLPARRVIIRTPNFHNKPIDTLTYRQMIGRAGRMGKDEKGESILICQKSDYQTAKELMSAVLRPVMSCLKGAGKLKRAILEVIASGVATSPEDVELFTNCTLLAVEGTDTLDNPIEDAVNFLKENEFIRLQKASDDTFMYVATCLGKACLSSSMAPDEGLALFGELSKARQCFVLETELHLIYLVTPYSACNTWGNIDWMFYLELWERIPASMKRVGELVGVRDSYLVNASRGKIQTNTGKLYHKLMVHKRFFIALALQDLVNEKSLGEVCRKFSCNRGMLQSLQQSASSFAGMVTSFSRQLGWTSVELLISQFQDRLQFGVSRDLLDLMRLPVLNGKMARTLYNAGIETVAQLANSEIPNVESILHTVMPFESEKEREGESEFENNKRKKIRNVWVTGKDGLTVREASELLIKDARSYLKIEMGLVDAKWEVSQKEKTDEAIADTYNTKEVTKEKINIEETILQNEKQFKSEEILKTKAEILNQEETSKNIKFLIKEKEIQNIKQINYNTNTNVEKISSPQEKLSYQNPESIQSEQLNSFVDFEMNISSVSMAIDEKTNSQDSDQSIFSDSFTLYLSDDFITPASPCTYRTTKDSSVVSEEKSSKMDISDDILMSSFSDDTENSLARMTKKRPRMSEKQSKNSLKKKKESLEVFNEQPLQQLDEDILDFSKLDIVDVCANEELFNTFKEELQTKNRFSLAMACCGVLENIPKVGLKTLLSQSMTSKSSFEFNNTKVEGVALSWGNGTVYHLSLESEFKVDVIKLLENVLSKKNNEVKMFDCKEQIKCLKLCCNVDVGTNIKDPKVADWILDPEGREKNLQALTLTYCPEAMDLVHLAGSIKGVGSVSLDLNSSIDSKIRSSVESLVTWYIVDSLNDKLWKENPNFLEVYDIEMKTSLYLSKMELNGMGVSKQKMQELADTLKNQMDAIENKCYSLAGRRFNISSPAEVSKVLGMYRGKKVSTRKEILEKSDHPVAKYVLQWRKLSGTITKMIYPLIRVIEKDRLHGCCITHTATGRITMHEPNLQTIFKDFEIVHPFNEKSMVLSCRGAFEALENCCLVSADYCQLELRLLAHLSGDMLLRKIMKSPGDVFRSIASKWNNVEESEVNDDMRQKAKHICYGIIYGMGCKTLSEQLKITEDEATIFMETFKNAYPGIQIYILRTIEYCKNTGYVETITGRRRYLPHIKHNNGSLRGQAERQAINTTVQGSAADIAKKAMVMIEEKILEVFMKSKIKPKLILHLHDELIYEVPIKYTQKMAKIMKKCMESAVHLTVPFPVKLRTGPTWGELTEYEL
ncbi:unnamed protein product [Brassicogethes aeneus]|uniref:DNA polymerase theta n=1 Tax=Brassicogethes aeneus TaxID=1431903 RepID=A0A9P0B0C3_BRAAE|nr:unnamed protein product [Brassicogethes aeneus]